MLKKLHIVLIVSILFLSFFSIDTYAASKTDIDAALDVINAPYKEYFVVNRTVNNGGDCIIIFYSNFDMRYEVYAEPADNDTFKYSMRNLSSQDVVYYVLFSYDPISQEYKQGSTYQLPTNNTYQYLTFKGVTASTFDIYNKDGSIFFQQAPVVTTTPILEVIMEMTPAIAEKIVETLKILVPFGVGLLALWIGLKILPMVLYRFL